ncbi:hypothetical protein ACWT_8152 [Actinoplanes sp. SE50]|uniref:DUF4153 domain-containing protein n=1 Tax=unclassified Actinoplanes TaxID=2626549 RepID=UPI00023EDD5F|nr:MULTISPECIES: DUF4173 domain-containing protein [unclassified Actinoplanes]AEV89161.1 hypothetical protein ACPL_8283 [Actinoplanes sp. SE50/110]ATO87567.1 hypothetical protein ACWT_8152 [Actinoplanes sp. SE50]SLM04985.1 hypothetical protein ACSP50_8300 [Actinoplanes sp. SE50/110]
MSTAPPALPTVQNLTKGPLHGPWPDTRLFRRRLPGPAGPAAPGTILAIVAGVAVTALTLPLGVTGVGWLITAVAWLAVLLTARPTAGPAFPPVPAAGAPRLGARLPWAAATIGLLSVGTFRSAGWLFALCVGTATLTFALAIGAGRSMRAVLTTYTLGPVAVLRAGPWLVRGLARVRRPRGAAPFRIAATAAVSVLLLVVFGLLFASADATFASVISAVLPEVSLDGVARWIFLAGLSAPLLSGVAYMWIAPPRLTDLDHTEGMRVGRLEAAVPLGLLTLLFAAFVAVQLTVLFGGDRHVRTTAGLTYAAYARGGFWQLCIVTGLTLLVLAGAARWAPREAPGDRAVFRAVLGSLTLLTLVIVASALFRMQVYIDTYGLTRLRLLVACCEGWFGVILLLVLLAGTRTRAPWLPRAAIAAGVLALIGLAAANPDLMIARNQMHRSPDRVDAGYLSGLSPDAVPALTGVDGPQRVCVLYRIRMTMPDDRWYEWNYGRAAARDIIGQLPPMAHDRCGAY